MIKTKPYSYARAMHNYRGVVTDLLYAFEDVVEEILSDSEGFRLLDEQSEAVRSSKSESA